MTPVIHSKMTMTPGTPSSHKINGMKISSFA
jgi:hypothetical protein